MKCCRYIKWIVWTGISIATILLLWFVSYLCQAVFKLHLFDFNLMEVFMFLSTVATAIATILLGFVANDQNKRLIDIEQSRKTKEESSIVILENYTNNCNSNQKCKTLSNELKNKPSDVNTTPVRFIMTNCGDAILKQIKIYSDGQLIFKSHIVLAPEKEKYVVLKLPSNIEEFEIEFISCYDVSTYGEFKCYESEKLLFLPVYYDIKHYHYNAEKRRK